MGLRIDHILLSRELASMCTTCIIDKTTRRLERPSDHAPVIVELGGIGQEKERRPESGALIWSPANEV
jgi:exodeoxyribonuclease-3